MNRWPRMATVDQADFMVAYLCAMHGLMFVDLFLAGSFIGTPAVLPLAFVTIALAVRFYARQLGRAEPRLSALDLVFSVYLLYSLASIVDYTVPGNPASMLSYLYGLNIQVVPMFTYFAVKGVDETNFRRILRVFVYLQAACGLIGIALFFGRPDFYTAYLTERLGYTADWQNYARLQSYMGSTATGILSAVAIALSAHAGLSRFARYSLALLFLLTIFLTQQRGAYVSGVLATAYLLYKSKVSPLQLVVALVVIGAIVVAAAASLGITLDLVRDIAQNRVIGDLVHGSPVGERAVSWNKGLGFVSQYPFGLGLGATTSAADLAGAHRGGQVVDAYYMRVAADLGMPGLIWFLLLLLVAGVVSISRERTSAIAVVVVIYAFQSVGTNVLDSFYVAHVFWMLLGYSGQRLARVPVPRTGWRLARATTNAPAPASGNAQ